MEWIKITDKLPKEDEIVLAYDGEDFWIGSFMKYEDGSIKWWMLDGKWSFTPTHYCYLEKPE